MSSAAAAVAMSSSSSSSSRLLSSTAQTSKRPKTKQGKKSTKKIVIRAYSHPPPVPPNFYEQQSKLILDTCASAVTATTTTSTKNCLQQAHARVVDLVQLKMGARLYADLVEMLQTRVIDQYCNINDSSSTTTSTGTTSTNMLLTELPSQYANYCHHLSVLRHVCLPLDRQYLWNPTTRSAILRSSTGTTASTTTSTASSSSSSSLLSLWQVGLHLYCRRLQQAKLDDELYDQWWNALWYGSWKQAQAQQESSSATTSTTTSRTSTCTTTPEHLQQQLTTVMRMWQDLGLQSSILKTKLYPQLVQHLQDESNNVYAHYQDKHSNSAALVATSTSSGSNNTTTTTATTAAAMDYIDYVQTKYDLVSQQWSSFLPNAWTKTLLQVYLIQPHLTHLLERDNLDLGHACIVSHIQKLYTLTNRLTKTMPPQTIMERSNATAPPPLAVTMPLSGSKSGSGAATTTTKTTTNISRSSTTLSAHEQISQAIVDCALQKGKQCFQHEVGVASTVASSGGGSTTTTASSSTAAPSASSIIQGLLELQALLQQLEQQLQTSLPLKQVFSVLMAEPQAAEALAKYMDASFKKCSSPTAIGNKHHVFNEDHLEQVLALFVHVSAKDVFEAFYKRDLAKRLLGGRVQNLDLEKHFLSLLKSECGAGYTSKMEGMFQDVEWSKETMARYNASSSSTTAAAAKQTQGGGTGSGVVLDVQVLTTGYWPMYPSYSLVLPECLQVPQQHFCDYYKKTYQGRRIRWQYALGHVTVRAKFTKQYDLVMGLSLGLVVLCFNDADKWTLPELQERIGLGDRAEMERILMTLSLGKVKLLKKWDYDAQSDKKPRADVHDHDWFTVNEEFSSPLKKIKISTIARHDTNKEERQKTMEMISRDRLYLLDAVLVRIMKARKTMLHSELIPLVMEHAKVPVTPTDVKGRIESLMDREYLERDKNDRNRYNYLA